MLYDRYLDKVYQYIYYRVGDVPLTEDLTSQVFMRAWEAIGQFRWQGFPFSAWLYRIARNLVVDYHRAHKPTLDLEDPELRSQLTAVDPASSPERSANWRFMVDHLRGAISHLTEEQQQVIILKFLQGFSTEEVAQRLGKTSGAVRALQFRALSALRGLMAEQGVDDDLI